MFVVFISCEEPVEQVADVAKDELKTELGAAGPNPYNAGNMMQALESVSKKSAKTNGRTLADIPSTTHNYVRFAPQNEDQLITLHDYGYDLYDVPLDQEITNQGEFYQDPSLPASAITYQYTLVPTNYSLPSTVPHTILYQVFLFDENAGDEQDPDWNPEPDPWIPEPDPADPRYCYDENGSIYVCNSWPRQYLRQQPTSLPEDLYQKATRELLAAGINPKELYNEAMKQSGHPEEMIDLENTSGRTQAVNPYGYVKVWDNVTNVFVPVKNVTVKTRRWFKLDETLTDANGYFAIHKSYKQKANVVLKFRNGFATIRGISGFLKLWEYIQVLEKECGLFSGAALQGMDIKLGYNSNADTHEALQWGAAHCLNTHYEMKQYSSNFNLIGPYPSLNVWISSAVTQAASAPMLRAVANTSQVNQAINHMFPGLATNIKKFVESRLPDVTLRLQEGSSTSPRPADRLIKTFFHEFAHSQHYSQVGNNYWASYIGYIVANGGYGNKTTSGSGRIAVGEAWGNFIGGTFNRTKYSSNSTIATYERNFLENQKRSDTYSIRQISTTIWEGWIPWGMLHDLNDTGEPSTTLINDQVNGYTLAGIFRGYQTNATTVQTLKSSILSNNGNYQASQVNTLVTSYGH